MLHVVIGDIHGCVDELLELLRPACSRIVVAGSIRRRKPDVGDIELLCIPVEGVLLGTPLDAALGRLISDGLLALRPNVKGSTTYGPMNKLLRHLPSGIPVDIFTADSRNWGMALVVRTGPAEFNIKMMARFQWLHMKGHAYGGVTLPNGNEKDCPDEEGVFRLLGWPYQEPEGRE